MTTTPEHAERDAAIVARRSAGETLQEIADRYGLSRERVRQITDGTADPAAKARATQRKREATAKARTERLAQQVAAAEQAVRAEAPDAYRLVRAIPRSDRSETLQRYLEHRHSADASTRATRFSDEQMMDALRRAAAHAEGEPLTAQAYNRHRDSADPSVPSYNQRYGGWRNAVRRAGLTAGQAIRAEYVQRFSDPQILDAVAAFLATSDGHTGHLAYDQWSRGHNDRPSGVLVRTRMKPLGWREIVAAAADPTAREDALRAVATRRAALRAGTTGGVR